ncbi:MAG: MATE family efflux transporter [Lachnospiraceae bacterium]|nr:MATE family efflux transporter [Lachnospiraceae bacterium]
MNLVQKFMTKFAGARDMTEGKPARNLIEFAVPLLIGNLAQLLYSTVDSIVVGKYVGDQALAAIGASMPLFNLVLVLFMGISVGAGIMISQYFGAKDRRNLSMTIGNSIILNIIASAMIMLVGFFLVEPFMRMLGTPEDIFKMSCSYLTIVFVGIIGCTFYNIFSGILRGMGDSVMPLFFLLISTVLNIALDLWFVIGFRLGVAGVAYATVLAQGISAVLCFLRIKSMKDVLDINKSTLKLEGTLVKRLIILGIPSGVSQMIFSMAALVVQSLTNSFGSSIITVSTVVMRVDSFAMMPCFTFGTAMTTYAGQNIGAGRLDRVKAGTRDGMKLGLSISAALVLFIVIFGKYLMSLFTNTQEIIDMSNRMMRMLSIGYIACAITQILSGVMRGAGDTVTPMWISIITTVFLRVPVAYGIAWMTKSADFPNGRPECIFISLLVSWTLGAVITTLFYKFGNWHKKGIVQQDN